MRIHLIRTTRLDKPITDDISQLETDRTKYLSDQNLMKVVAFIVTAHEHNKSFLSSEFLAWKRARPNQLTNDINRIPKIAIILTAAKARNFVQPVKNESIRRDLQNLSSLIFSLPQPWISCLVLQNKSEQSLKSLQGNPESLPIILMPLPDFRNE